MKNTAFRYLITTILSLIVFTQSIFAGVPPNLVAESAILMDRATGEILYQKNANVQMYPASTTKILSSILYIENMNLNAIMSKTPGSIQNVPSDSSHIGLQVGDMFSIEDALYAVILGSDNYAAYDLAIQSDSSISNFADRMNHKAREIGATHSHFVNPHGYHHPEHYTTAYDLALIADYAFQNETFRTIAQAPTYQLIRKNDPSHPIAIRHTVQLLQQDSPYYSPYVIGGKTGFNTPAGRSLVAVAEKDGMELIGVVLKSTTPEFFEDMNALFNYGFDNFTLTMKSGTTALKNVSFSPWAKETIEFASTNNIIDSNITQSYQTPITKEDFIQLLMRTIHVAQTQDASTFSNERAVAQALDWKLIQSSSLLSGFKDSLSRQTAATITERLLLALHYQPMIIYPYYIYDDNDSIAPYAHPSVYHLQQNGLMGSYTGGDFHPNKHLTLEEGITIATKLYKIYSHSPYAFLNKTKMIQ